jgi:hypothetical protein
MHSDASLEALGNHLGSGTKGSDKRPVSANEKGQVETRPSFANGHRGPAHFLQE